MIRIGVLCWTLVGKYFLPVCGLSFVLFNSVFCRADVFIYPFSLPWVCFGVFPSVFNCISTLLRPWAAAGAASWRRLCGCQASACSRPCRSLWPRGHGLECLWAGALAHTVMSQQPWRKCLWRTVTALRGGSPGRSDARLVRGLHSRNFIAFHSSDLSRAPTSHPVGSSDCAALSLILQRVWVSCGWLGEQQEPGARILTTCPSLCCRKLKWSLHAQKRDVM